MQNLIRNALLLFLLTCWLPYGLFAQEDYDYYNEKSAEKEKRKGRKQKFYTDAFKLNLTSPFFTDVSAYYERRFSDDYSIEVKLTYIRKNNVLSDFYLGSNNPVFLHQGFSLGGGYRLIFQNRQKFQFNFSFNLQYRLSFLRNKWVDQSGYTGQNGDGVKVNQTYHRFGVIPLATVIFGEELLWELYMGFGIQYISNSTDYLDCSYCTGSSQPYTLVNDNVSRFAFTLHGGLKIGYAFRRSKKK